MNAKESSAAVRLEELSASLLCVIEPGLTAITILKSRGSLNLFCRDELLKEYSVIIGRNALGHKHREGDNKTPEGEYFICYRNAESRFHLFMGLSYPNENDARAALERGDIDPLKFQEIANCLKRRERPDWYTPLGGEVGIHGGGTHRKGTAGCIALSNEDVEEIWAATTVGTLVTIKP